MTENRIVVSSADGLKYIDDRVVVPNIDDYEEEAQREDFQKGFDMMKNFCDLVNRFDGRETVKGMVAGMICSHRTLQQSAVRTFMTMLLMWGRMVEKEPNRFTDLRNQDTADFVKNVLSKCEGFRFI